MTFKKINFLCTLLEKFRFVHAEDDFVSIASFPGKKKAAPKILSDIC